MDPVSTRLPPTHVEAVEEQLQARAAQLKPREVTRAARPAPLGYCRVCRTVVYAGDSLAMAGVYVLHGDCTLEGSSSPPPACA